MSTVIDPSKVVPDGNPDESDQSEPCTKGETDSRYRCSDISGMSLPFCAVGTLFDGHSCANVLEYAASPVYERDSMSHVLAYDGQFFRVDITEVANPDDPDQTVYISWCSDAFKELKDMPSQAFITIHRRLTASEVRRSSSPRLRLDQNQLGCPEGQAGR